MNKLAQIIIAVIAIALAAFLMFGGTARDNDILEIEESKIMTPEYTPPSIPDDELIHTVKVTSLYESSPSDVDDIFWDSETHWLAMALETESGVDWPDWAVIMIGDVIMHRVASPSYPNTVKEVLLDPGQYSPFFDPFEPFMPEERYIELAERVLDGESYLTDTDILFQALFPQGSETVVTYYDEALRTTTYFCK